MSGNVVLLEIDALVYVGNKPGGKHMSYGELVLLNVWRYNRGVAPTEAVIT